MSTCPEGAVVLQADPSVVLRLQCQPHLPDAPEPQEAEDAVEDEEEAEHLDPFADHGEDTQEAADDADSFSSEWDLVKVGMWSDDWHVL